MVSAIQNELYPDQVKRCTKHRNIQIYATCMEPGGQMTCCTMNLAEMPKLLKIRCTTIHRPIVLNTALVISTRRVKGDFVTIVLHAFLFGL